MARSAEQVKSLRALVARADKLSATARKEWLSCIVEIRKEIDYLSRRLNIGGSATDREKVILAIEAHIVRLNRRLDRLVEAQLAVAQKTAHAEANKQMGNGLEVKYSQRHANEILELVRTRGGQSLAATFTDSMTKNAIYALRSAVVAAFNEQAIEGGSMKELARSIRDKWEAATEGTENFRFTDKRGRTWDTDTYIQMNVRTNTMEIYNAQMLDTITRGTGSDLVRISDDGRTADSCEACQYWAGKIVSVTGKTQGFPTLDEAKADGVFHPNCIHTLEPVIEEVEQDEIEKQRQAYAEEGED